MLSNLNLNKRLALIAVVIGFIGLFAGSPYKGNTVKMDTKELSLIVQNEVDHVSVDELADWIIKEKSDYRLIDLRNEKDFGEYHIPNAENVTLPQLENYNITRSEKIILYSDGGIHSAQGWMLLKAKDFKGVYMLTGGLDEWKTKVLFPIFPENGTAEEKTAFEKKKEISKFFGGSPITGQQETGTNVTPKMEMPKIESPGGVNPAPTTGKKKKEGC